MSMQKPITYLRNSIQHSMLDLRVPLRMHYDHDSGCSSRVHDKADEIVEYVAGIYEEEEEDEGEN